ncbi:MAG: biotin--[acetyl-CoA-carboxylase] ligase [Verrucomicrobia bacterium]|nr:biotin--[acetyl-CoA-carboxylase] ligase [Verrucomicrobiota bacterium]
MRDVLASTNDEARRLAGAGAADGLVILAEQQSAGRGRRGATWYAAPGESLAFSIIVRPTEPKALWPRLALAAGLAVAEAAAAWVPLVGIKWPNDIWIGRRKLAGILVEASQDFAVVGIGINVNTLEFPPAVADLATSLRIAAGRALDRAAVLTSTLRHFELRRRQLDAGFDEVLAAVRLRCVLTGHAVTLVTASGPRHGIMAGLGPGGELLLRTPSGLEHIIQADEVRLTAPE